MLFQQIRNLLKKNQRGSILVEVLLAIALLGMIAPNVGQLMDAVLGSSDSFQAGVTATAIAKNTWEGLGVTVPYGSIASQGRTVVDAVLGIEQEILVTERNVGGGVTQKTVTINVYRTGEATPVVSLPKDVYSNGPGDDLHGKKKWTSPGTYYWTVPTGVTKVWVTIAGGGGGGGRGARYEPSYYWGGSGGAGASYAWEEYNVTPGETITVIVGAGGSPAGSAYYYGYRGGRVGIRHNIRGRRRRRRWVLLCG